MSFQDTHKWGSLYVDAQMTLINLDDWGYLDKGERREGFKALEDTRHEFSFDGDYPHGCMYTDDKQETPLVLINWFGGYPGDSIDDANAQAAEEWASERNHIYSFDNWFGGCKSVGLYIDMDVATLEEVEEAIEFIEGFLDYPVLDEDLWSELGLKRWDEMIDEMINDTQREKDIEFSDAQIFAIRELASEMYGYWEEDYFPSDEWDSIIEEVLAVEPGTVVQLHQADKLF